MPIQQTPEQIAFCDEIAFGTESIMLSAVAGSGKTTTIISALEGASVPSYKTLLLAFNTKIKDELSRRAPKGTNVKTLNGLGHQAWKRHIGRNPVLDSKKVGTIVSELCRNPDLKGYWADVKDLVDKAKASGLLHKHFATGNNITLIEDTRENWQALAELHGISFDNTVYELARKALRRSIEMALAGSIDFDDQLYMPACFNASFEKFLLVMVDEAQDLSEIQHTLIARTVAREGRLVIVGDPNQAIYGFRGALSDSMAQLAQKFDAKQMSLSVSFRCSQSAIALAQRYVPRIQAAPANQVGSVTQLGETWQPTDLPVGATVLCRNIAPLVKLGMKCIKLGVSAYVYGSDIGAPLIKAAKVLPLGQNVHDSIVAWIKLETVKAQGNMETLSRINDTGDALLAVTEVANVQTAEQLQDTLKTLFSKTEGSILLSTIHRAKGLEWNNVFILDAWRMPQGWIKKIVKDNPNARWMLQQENNLAYIAITRTKDKLTFIEYPKKGVDDGE